MIPDVLFGGCGESSFLLFPLPLALVLIPVFPWLNFSVFSLRSLRLLVLGAFCPGSMRSLLPCKTTPLIYNILEREKATNHFYHIYISLKRAVPIYTKTVQYQRCDPKIFSLILMEKKSENDKMHSSLTLERISNDLFMIFENEILFQRYYPPKESIEKRTEEYFEQKSKEKEMENGEFKDSEIEPLKNRIFKDILPAYSDYRQIKDSYLEKIENRSLLKYIGFTLLGLEALEAIFFKTGVFAPPVIIVSVFFEILLGWAIYILKNLKDQEKTIAAKVYFFKTVHNTQKSMYTDIEYSEYQNKKCSDQINSEINVLLKKYDNKDHFWDDFVKIRKYDPTTQTAFEKLNTPKFGDFMLLHFDDKYNSQIRKIRYDELFKQAELYFENKQ